MELHGMWYELVMLVAVLVALSASKALAAAQAKPGCPHRCGELEIPYPFGTKPDCFLNEEFFIYCNTSAEPHQAFLAESNIPVVNITPEGRLHIMNFVSGVCYVKGKLVSGNSSWLGVSNSPVSNAANVFTVSSAANVFTVIGCDSYAYIRGSVVGQSYIAGCMSLCEKLDYVTNGSCIGTGCCQIPIPRGLQEIDIEAYSFSNHRNVSSFNPCTYAFLVDQSQFNFSSDYLVSIPPMFPVVLDWKITTDGTCEEANSSNICGENALCYKPNYTNTKDSAYLCKCKGGYDGNPYLGCQDVDECKQNLHKCDLSQSICVNNNGNYTCVCNNGYDGKESGCIDNDFPLIKVTIGVGIFFVALIVSSSWLYLVLKKRNLIRLKEKFFQQNGGFLLQQQLSKRSGSSDTAKIFTAEELKKATNNYAEDRIIGRGGFGTVFIGFLTDDGAVAIKKSKLVDQKQIEQFINEVVVLSQINHRNVVRLLGCCLETEVPLLVYEFVSNGTLYEHIHNKEKFPTISWEIRLRIAAETAEVLSYLHSAASTPIIHRDVKSTNILLDDNYTAKVSDFGASKLVPVDETQLSTMVQGTLGYLDPEYLHTSQLTEKSDVYSFGVVLVELLTGKKALLFDRPEEERSLVMYFLSSLKENALLEILDNQIVSDGNKEQLKKIAELAAGCLRVKGEERPTMREVAMELQGMRMMNKYPWGYAETAMNPEETQHLLSEKPSDAYKFSDGSSSTAGYDSTKDHVQLVAFDDGR